MSGDADPPTTTDEQPVPDCPRCGRPVATVTLVGPADAVAGPCGCRVAPGSVTEPDLE